ncbi:hypothetical protein ACIBSS_27005 [Micromonospora aurantiaca]|uniref:hypothetical protein n=1 Tax=Micromonospora aurantiaca (nom. illeg.) TaxID=47850 RepID=UPI0037A63B8C
MSLHLILRWDCGQKHASQSRRGLTYEYLQGQAAVGDVDVFHLSGCAAGVTLSTAAGRIPSPSMIARLSDRIAAGISQFAANAAFSESIGRYW